MAVLYPMHQVWPPRLQAPWPSSDPDLGGAIPAGGQGEQAETEAQVLFEGGPGAPCVSQHWQPPAGPDPSGKCQERQGEHK